MTAPRDELRLLSIFHYLLAALAGLFSLFPLLYVGLGSWMLSGKFPRDPRGSGPPAFIGWFFVGAGLAMLVMGLCYAALLALAGRFLARTRHWTFCMVMAALSCAIFPFGTVLGVFTVLVLSRGEVRALFEPQGTTLAGPPPGA